MTRYLSITLPELACGAPSAPDATVVSFAKLKGAHRLVAVNEVARRRGLAAGMSLADARAMYPSLEVREHDPAEEAARLAALLAWSRRFTPLAAIDPPDGIILDITGAAHLFGGEAKLRATIESRLAARRIKAHAAIASTPEAAWAFARFSPQRIVAAEVDAKRLSRLVAPLPLAALRLDDGIVAALAQTGLKRIGDILLRPRAPIAARFGAMVFARLDAMLGEAKSPITPVFDAPAYLVERNFAEGIVQREAIEATILSLAGDLCAMLERHGEGARRLYVSLFRVDGIVKHIEAGSSRPLREPAIMAALMRERIAALSMADEEDPLDAGYGFDLVRLAALAVEPLPAEQTRFAPNGEAAMFEDRTAMAAAELADLIDRLSARISSKRVLRFVPNDTHIPEFAVLAVAAAQAPRSLVSRRQPAAAALIPSEAESTFAPSRPLRLFEKPEPIETIAMVPDGPPVRFRWRRVLHDIIAMEGPERISPEWWKLSADALTRDYFRVEDKEGHRFWLFREGLFSSEVERPRWYLHGLFA